MAPPADDPTALWPDVDVTVPLKPYVWLRGPEAAAARAVVTASARLGPLAPSWDVADTSVPAATTVEVPLNIPDAAFLDEVATDYLTDLVVRVEVFDAKGYEMDVQNLGPYFIAWEDGAPVVRDRAAALETAPYGVTSAALQAEVASRGLSITRMMPPLWESHPVARSPVEETTPPSLYGDEDPKP